MKTFEFSIIASGLDPEAEDFADRFFNAGCDDATLSSHRNESRRDYAILQGPAGQRLSNAGRPGDFG
ncbi:MAG: hypothetical protein QOD11_3410 [Bradyrhizobium sp.]|jgi:hypothetical protein|nr:hypothetical protein [Bradyrhizobium sp.]